MRRAAFTLVEALVVIGIIIILVGISIPAIGKIQSESQSLGCIANLKQLFSGVEVYRQANNTLLPNAEPLPAVGVDGPIGGLPAVLKAYVSRESTSWLCPADSDPESFETGTSYLYLPGLYILTPGIQLQLPPNAFDLPPKQRRTLEAQLVTALYEGDTPLPLLLDSQDRHPIGTRIPRNGVYIDGSARVLPKSLVTPAEP